MTTNKHTFSIREVDGSGNSFEIDDSERIIGRGIFLGVTDKRISRNHGILRATAKGIELKSIHVNPCFYKRKITPKKWVKLDQNDAVLLENGDIFSLLPKSRIYEIIGPENDEISAEDAFEKTNKNGCAVTPEKRAKTDGAMGPKDMGQGDEKVTANANKPVKGVNNGRMEGPDQIGRKSKEPRSISESNIPSESPPESQRKKIIQTNSHTEVKPENLHSNDAGEIATPSIRKKRKLPAWMLVTTPSKSPQETPKKIQASKKHIEKTSTAKDNPKNTPNSKRKNLIFTDSSDDEEDYPGVHKDARSSSRPSQGSGEIGNVDKTDVVEVVDQSMMADMSKLNAPGDGESPARDSSHIADENAPGSLSRVVESSDDKSAADLNCATPDVSRTREPCGFGSSCYRKNPLHFANFSHPGDPDYTVASSDSDGDKPDCPHGTNCFRKNPLHRKKFKHSKRIAPKRQAKRSKKDDESTGDDEYDDSFINDDSEDDVDAGVSEEEDSDWEPSAENLKRSKRRRNESNSSSEDEEDVSQLVSDANKFARNKNMWK